MTHDRHGIRSSSTTPVHCHLSKCAQHLERDLKPAGHLKQIWITSHLDLSHSTCDNALDDSAAVIVQQMDLVDDQQLDLNTDNICAQKKYETSKPLTGRAVASTFPPRIHSACLLCVGAVSTLASDDVPLLWRDDDHLQALCCACHVGPIVRTATMMYFWQLENQQKRAHWHSCSQQSVTPGPRQSRHG